MSEERHSSKIRTFNEVVVKGVVVTMMRRVDTIGSEAKFAFHRKLTSPIVDATTATTLWFTVCITMIHVLTVRP